MSIYVVCCRQKPYFGGCKNGTILYEDGSFDYVDFYTCTHCGNRFRINYYHDGDIVVSVEDSRKEE